VRYVTQGKRVFVLLLSYESSNYTTKSDIHRHRHLAKIIHAPTFTRESVTDFVSTF
jgi:hypothetical protein